ncbi:carotenoid oxygenase family protein [Ilumatobacter sp.]|uniref:carotenoid oxygenase family protein n=1 Tax=Ilumatobacter sp. TaxID=1967498 RepID=UPI003C4656FB
MTALDETQTDVPFYMKGNYAPVREEIDAVDLPVTGALPPELNGRFFRNGANPPEGVVPAHWFDGDGMLHGIRLRDGKAEWYRNRWIRTKLLAGGARMDPETFEFDLSAGRANTHVMRHGGKILALEEGSFPHEITPELDTVGSVNFDGRLDTPFTAHPHVCAETGEMHFFGYGLVTAPYVTYHVADRSGQLIHSQPVEIPNPVMMHDFAVSRNHAIFLDLPVVFDLDVALSGQGMPFLWRPDNGSRIGLIDRRKLGSGTPVEPRWFEIDTCYVFHIVNAWEEDDGNVVVLDAGRHQAMWADGPDSFEPCYLWRWRFDLRTGAVTEEQLDDSDHAFPRIDDRRTGLANRYSWAVAGRPDEPPVTDAATGVRKYDVTSGASTFHDFGPGRSTSEPVFVPASESAAEDEGWVLSFVYDKADQSSTFTVLDASNMAADPVATIAIPQRVPHGFHGSWIPDE